MKESAPDGAQHKHTPVQLLRTRLYDGWMAIQVELQGQYSIERLQKLRTYAKEKSVLYVTAVGLITPIPCLALITLVDCIRLQPPEAGIYDNNVFWMRNYLAVAFITLSVMEQFRNCLPNFPLSHTWMVIITVAATTTGVSQQFGVAHVVGFPLPFALVVGTTGWLVMVVACCYYLWGAKLRTDVQARGEFLDYMVVFTCQVSLTLIYPAYIYVFNALGSRAQTLFVLLLPVIKLSTKNWISRFLTDMDDMKPEVVIFNIELFNALYVTYCMQNSTSKLTTVVIMFTDFIQAWISMKDMNELFVEVQHMMYKIQWLKNQPPPSIIDIANDIIENDENVRQHPGLRLKSLQSEVLMLRSAQTKSIDVKSVASFKAPTIVPVTAETIEDAVDLTESLPAVASKCVPSVESGKSTESEPPPPEPKSIHDQRRIAFIMAGLDEEERFLFVKKTVQILFVTEFMVLIEYTEVVIPIIYSMYMTIMFQLPNRAYYAQLKDLSDDRLAEIISNVMMYSSLEMISFLAISLILRYRLRLSTAHQLAFVLDTQRSMVQSKLILWTFYVVQSSLDHFGVDFSLQFAWLNKSN